MLPFATYLVHGVLILGQEVASFSGATVRVYIEEVSRMDAPAEILAKESISDVHHQAGKASCLDFALRAGPVDPAAHYSVRAHVDLDNNGKLDPGDLVTVESYPVLTFGHPDHVTLHVRKVE
ncbi:YbaY family lipoprotein [Halomonas cerina]|uniref:Putative lipoprotein YbaY n=1 Tax=Halomonas cerina TaxID=447424 RepID=A0A839VBI3_9GAMM|nr:YbaY family lipoprotein [Halomonas cerina]MBB3192491.1 putative lipoprotein YbaY [Halomonas cerina]